MARLSKSNQCFVPPPPPSSGTLSRKSGAAGGFQGRRDQNAATNGECSHSEKERKDMGSCVCRPSQILIHSSTPGSSTPGPVRGHIAATSCLPLCLSLSLPGPFTLSLPRLFHGAWSRSTGAVWCWWLDGPAGIRSSDPPFRLPP